MKIRSDCIHFKGHVPCTPHKLRGVHCEDCREFRKRSGRILMIKLGAAGDVVRTTPLLGPLREKFPDHALTWVTEFPELLPGIVDDPLRWDTNAVLLLRHLRFDLLINLDKDRQACALAKEVSATRKIGFTLGSDGVSAPILAGATPEMAEAVTAKLHTGLFDDVNQACRLSYLQEIFAICGFEFSGQEYVLDRPEPAPEFDLPSGKAVIGLNTGCGGRWTSRLWPEKYWRELATNLGRAGFAVVLLGGPQEDEKNIRLAAATGACYPGHFDLKTFIGLMDRCDLVVSAVTMAMHLALGLGKRLVLLNNIFNPYEFELYGRGVILAPEQKCSCFFQPRCTASEFCLETLHPETVMEAVNNLLSGS
ncbi:MAG: glycosyltransferase family 9 protein [Gemmatimonadales bacterium]|nr:glycosyltransferase family 9 protein [Gemmatimonadales bacterium]